MFSPRPDWRHALAHALHSAARIDIAPDDAPHVLDTLSAQRLLALDASLRSLDWTATLPGPVWPVIPATTEGERDAQLFCLGTHGDGRLRERALRLARERDSGLTFALALIRCDDWVDPVRDTALETLRMRVRDAPETVFVHVDLILALRGRQRFDAGAWRDPIEPALLHPAHRPLRWALLERGHGRSRLFACGLALQADPDRATELARRAVRDRDPVIARWALQVLPASTAQDGDAIDSDVLSYAYLHASASVRAQALRLHAQRPDAAYAARVRETLLDASASVRSVARYAARGLGIDAHTIFRDALDHGEAPADRNAVLALADCADADDLDRLRPWLHHVNGEVRCAAVRGALRAGIENPIGMLREALAAPSGKVVKLALALGTTLPGFMTRETLAAGFAAATTDGNRLRLLEATRRIDRWSALECFMDCLDSTQHQDIVLHALRAWTGEVGARFTPLPDLRRNGLLARVDAIRKTHPQGPWAEVRHLLETG